MRHSTRLIPRIVTLGLAAALFGAAAAWGAEDPGHDPSYAWMAGADEGNAYLTYGSTETGEDYLSAFRKAERGELGPFILVVEGSIPNENINGEGYWTSMGNDLETGEPITLNEWLDRLAHKAWAVVAAGTCATFGGIHTMAGNPTGAMGLADYLGWDFRSAGGLPIGLQLIGRRFEESTVLRAAHAYEQATPWHRRRPPV